MGKKCGKCEGHANLFYIKNSMSKQYLCTKCKKITTYNYKKVLESVEIEDAPTINPFKKLQK